MTALPPPAPPPLSRAPAPGLRPHDESRRSSPQSRTEWPVVIVGGGMAGLSAAYALHKAGQSFLLFESQPRLGGVVLSEAIDNFIVDGGPDSLLVQKPEAIALCRELGLGDSLVTTKLPRRSYILRAGRLHALPAHSVLGIPTTVGPFLNTGLFSWAGKARMALEYLVPRRTDGADESIGGFMTRRFGREACDYLAEPLLAGIHAGDVDQLSLRALFPRFAQAEADHGSLLRAFRQRPTSAPEGDGPFRSLKGGLSQLVRALEAALPNHGVRTGVDIARIDRVSGDLAVVDSTGVAHPARAVVMAAPAYACAALVRALNPSLADLCAEIPYASAGTVALAYPRASVGHTLEGSGFVVPRAEGSPISAASFLSSKWPGRAPDNIALLRAFFGGARDPRALDRTDDELMAVAHDALAPVLHLTARPSFAKVYRWPRANAQHNTGHLARMTRIDAALGSEPGLFITGSGFRGVGIPDVVADARATATKVMQWLDGLI